MQLNKFLERRNWIFWGLVGAFFLILIGLTDYFSGFEISLTLFYLLPIGIYAWYISRRAGVSMAVVSALVWFVADYSGGLEYTNQSIFVWNTLIRVGLLVVSSILLSMIRKNYMEHRNYARMDFITGAANPRYFYELLKAEIDRTEHAERPISVVYLDVDNFKQINDTFGHSAGDDVLRTVVDSIRQQIRSMDVITRMGGDEFAFFLSGADEEAARQAVTRIQQGLNKNMSQIDRNITFSIGVVTFKKIPGSVDEIVKIADQTMYKVKNSTKNGVSYLLME